MAKSPQLSADNRVITGRKVKQLRRQSLIPANVFGKSIDSIAVQLDQAKLKQMIESAGETTLIDLIIGQEKKARPVLITNVQYDPVTDDILHVDFHQVDLTQKVTASVPVELTGESVAVKEKDGVVNQALLEVEVEALPADLPENITADISILENIGDNILVKDLKVPSKVDILLDQDAVVVSIIEQAEEEPEEVAPSEAEVEGEIDTEAGADAETPAGETAAPEADKPTPEAGENSEKS